MANITYRRRVDDAIAGGIVTAIVAAIVALIAAWLTHSVWAMKALMAGADAGQIVLALLGIFVPPIGVIHGVVLWFT